MTCSEADVVFPPFHVTPDEKEDRLASVHIRSMWLKLSQLERVKELVATLQKLSLTEDPDKEDKNGDVGQ